MDKAFDVSLNSKVDAVDIAKIPYRFLKERSRYKCLCCGEEVYLAAADSREQSPHFRHKRGNNDTECERYLGQPGAVEDSVLLRRHKQIEFYFNRNKMIFEICASFTEKELREYEEKNSNMTVSSKPYAEPFLSIPLNKRVFISDGKSYFNIMDFSMQYYVSFDSGINPCIYRDVMKTPEKINIFKVRIQDEHCRHQKSSLLYTNTRYIGISENEEVLQELAYLEYVKSEERFSFGAENRRFFGLQFYVERTGYSVLQFFQEHDYQIETSEVLSILWPPIYTRDSCSICSEDTIYVHSSFELIPHVNMNADGTFDREVSKDVLKLHIDKEVRIHEKNINVCIQRERELEMKIVPEEPETTYSDRYTIPDQYDYFLFNQSGCTRMTPGSNVYLSESDRIVGYKNGHIKAFVYACPKEKTDTRQLINDILKYHPQSEPFKPDDFMDITTDEAVLSYLENCYRSGRINTVIKQYIKEESI